MATLGATRFYTLLPGLLKKHSACAILVVTHPLSRFYPVCKAVGFVWRFENIPLWRFNFQRGFLIPPRTYCHCLSFLFPNVQQSFWYWFIKPRLAMSSSHTVDLFHIPLKSMLIVPFSLSSRCLNESIIMTALHLGCALLQARLCNRHVNAFWGVYGVVLRTSIFLLKRYHELDTVYF